VPLRKAEMNLPMFKTRITSSRLVESEDSNFFPQKIVKTGLRQRAGAKFRFLVLR